MTFLSLVFANLEEATEWQMMSKAQDPIVMDRHH